MTPLILIPLLSAAVSGATAFYERLGAIAAVAVAVVVFVVMAFLLWLIVKGLL